MNETILLVSLIVAVVLGMYMFFKHKLDLYKVDATRDNAEYERGFEAGLEQGAMICESHTEHFAAKYIRAAKR